MQSGKIIIFLYTLIAFLVPNNIQAQDSHEEKSRPLVYMFTIDQEIFKPALRIFNNAMDEADSLHADVILLRLNTYGGAVDVADKMRSRLLESKPETIVYIYNNAASAGALISISCDSIYMKNEATIGAATVVDQSGAPATDKYQSYFRGKFRATAEKQGRNPEIAEAMVDQDIAIPGIIDSGKILTFTATEALKYDFCDGIVNNEKEALAMAGYENYELVEYKTSALDKIIGFFSSPMLSGLLLSVIFLGIFFELQTPGIGFPLIAAILAAVLYFVPLWLDGLAENWEILIFVIGIILIMLELFIIPGFGIAGISGIILTFSGLLLSLINNVQFDFSMTGSGDVSQALIILISSLLLTSLGVYYLSSRFFKSPLLGKLIFHDTQQSKEGYDVDLYKGMKLEGKTAIVVTDLHPSGKIELEEERYDAHSAGEFIARGKKVIILKASGTNLLVEEIQDN